MFLFYFIQFYADTEYWYNCDSIQTAIRNKCRCLSLLFLINTVLIYSWQLIIKYVFETWDYLKANQHNNKLRQCL